MSSAPAALSPLHECAGLPSLTTGAEVVVMLVRGTTVSVRPSMRTETVAAPALPEKASVKRTPRRRPRERVGMKPPLSARAYECSAGGRSPGFRAPLRTFPERLAFQWLPHGLRRRVARSQWRVRAGIAP